jgi:hypothetical protein
MTPTATQNSWQNFCATVTAVRFPDPAGPVRNIIDCLCPPLAFKLRTMFSIVLLLEHSMVCTNPEYNVVVGSLPSWTKPRRNVHAIVSYAMYCFSSSFRFSYLATFLAVSAKVGILFIFIVWL